MASSAAGAANMAAARMTLALLDANPRAAEDLSAAGRLLIFNKGTNAHDYNINLLLCWCNCIEGRRGRDEIGISNALIPG